MKLTFSTIVCALAMAGGAAAADTTNLVFHVQLVRGSDEPTPPSKKSQAIGPTLAAQFRPVIAWKYYWETGYQVARLTPGSKTKLRLSPRREVEIDLSQPGKRVVTAYARGKPVNRVVDRVEAPMTLTGGDRDAKSAWFIAVRRDKPTIH
jgi:hypothetical protein